MKLVSAHLFQVMPFVGALRLAKIASVEGFKNSTAARHGDCLLHPLRCAALDGC